MWAWGCVERVAAGLLGGPLAGGGRWSTAVAVGATAAAGLALVAIVISSRRGLNRVSERKSGRSFWEFARAESEEDAAAAEVVEGADLGIVGDDTQVSSDGPLSPAPGVETVVVFPKNAGKMILQNFQLALCAPVDLYKDKLKQSAQFQCASQVQGYRNCEKTYHVASKLRGCF
ncbi:unnamed protein product [Miscanthus lutarioriparius]|uniref:Uncharacterized protein n=1 Tax=Miscanthus lutarioriparius TaxID=422564 RepID=A0A811SF39_9POAL|nr:unnamed protein product [Miscanthus lutarioriparius]